MTFVVRFSSPFLIILVAASALFAQPPSGDLAKQLDSAFSGLASADTPGFALLVTQDGKIVFEKGMAFAICAAKLRTMCERIFAWPPSPNNLRRWASCCWSTMGN